MVKKVDVLVFLLFGLVKLGCSLRCYTCSGDLQQCNRQFSDSIGCSDEQTACASLVRNSPTGMNFFFGCATEMDCQVSSAVCSNMMKDMAENPEDNAGVSCDATCCSSSYCAKPYPIDYKPHQCYDCSSMDECKTPKLKTCANETDRCFKLSTEVTYKEANVEVKTYSKGCAPENLCNSKEKNVFYKTCPNDEQCHLSCCEGGMCNTGVNEVVSALAMTFCTTVAIFSQ